MADIEIRPLREADVGGGMALIHRAVAAMHAAGYMQWNDAYPNGDVMRRDIAAGTAYGAWLGGRLAGLVTVDGNQSPEYAPIPFQFGEPAMVVHRLAVDPDLQRRGVSRRLMDFAEEHARRRGAAAIRLDTCEDNAAALGLYFDRGYVRRGTCHFPPRTLTFIVMEKKLK